MSGIWRINRANLVVRIALGLVVGLSLMAAACSSTPSSAGIVLTVTPATAYIPVSSSFQFGVTVSGTPNSLVVWSAGGVVGGNATVGFISSTGFYRAPASVPSPAQVTITATSQYDAISSSSATATIVSQTSGAHAVQVASGQTITNINVQVPQLTPTLTIYGAGTCAGSTCSTSATGAQVTQGSSATIFLVGNGVVGGNGLFDQWKPHRCDGDAALRFAIRSDKQRHAVGDFWYFSQRQRRAGVKKYHGLESCHGRTLRLRGWITHYLFGAVNKMKKRPQTVALSFRAKRRKSPPLLASWFYSC